MMSDWNGTILGPPHVSHRPRTGPPGSVSTSADPRPGVAQSAYENRIYSLTMHCGPEYPDKPPTIKFVHEINLPCVNKNTGEVMADKLPCLTNWKRESTMETVLIELRRFMASPQCKKLPQPKENSTFPGQQ